MCVRLAENVSEKNRFVKIMVQQILDGVLQPGDRLPTESELAAQYGIAKTNVHLGLKEVARLGFLKIVPRHASYVTDIWSHITLDSLSAMVQYSADKPERTAVSAFLELREMLGCGAIRWMVRRPNPAHVCALKAHCAEMERAVQEPDRTAFWSALRAFLVCMYMEIDNPIFPVLVRSARDVAHRSLELMDSYFEPEQVVTVYREVLEMIEQGNAVEAVYRWTVWNDELTEKFLHNIYDA